MRFKNAQGDRAAQVVVTGGCQSCEDPVPKQPLQAPDALLVRPRQRTAHGGDIGQPAQAQDPLHQRVIGIV